MLMHSPFKIICNTNVQYTPILIGEHINYVVVDLHEKVLTEKLLMCEDK